MVADLNQVLSLSRALIVLQSRSAAQHKIALALGWVAQTFSLLCAYIATGIIVWHFGSIAGWKWPDVTLLLSVYLMSYSLGAAFTYTQFRDLEQMVENSAIDAILTLPVSTWLYISLSGLNLSYCGYFLFGAGISVWAIQAIASSLDVIDRLYLIFSVVNGALIVGSIMSSIGAVALVSNRSRPFYAVIAGLWEFCRYPLTIFPPALELAFITFLPVGLISFVPVASILGHAVPFVGATGGDISLFSGPICALLACLFWRRCVRKYRER